MIFSKKTLSNNPKQNDLFCGFNRKANLIHSQLRMQCSNLRDHLFKLHVVDSPTCLCSARFETSYHYFFDCPLYNSQRCKLFNIT